MATATRIIRVPRGTSLTCKGWPQEAALRMLMNNLDPDVAERPEDLVVYGGSGKAARSWEAFDAIVRSLTSLEHDETLLVQSGKPVGVFQTHPGAPRVLIANALLVPAWATWENFRDLEQRGLTMYGQMTAGSWIYIGSQGIVQGTYETLAAVGRRHFGGTLSGRLVVTAGLGGMGGAQPLAAAMNGAATLVVEVDPQRIARRLATRYLDEATDSLDEALDRVGRWTRDGLGRSIALRGNAADVLPALVARGVTPDVVTDQTAAHDALNGYVPNGLSLDEAVRLRERNPSDYIARSMAAMADHVRAMLELFPHHEALVRWIHLARERVAFQGLPARILWLGYGERARFGLRINELVRDGRITAPIVIGRDHLDSGSVASPNRETEGMRDGSDAIADWPILNAMLNTASGATWVSFHHGGGVGIGYSIHAGQVIVADGTPAAAGRLERVLINDPASGVMRHADAGYDIAIDCAREYGLKLPMLDNDQ